MYHMSINYICRKFKCERISSDNFEFIEIFRNFPQEFFPARIFLKEHDKWLLEQINHFDVCNNYEMIWTNTVNDSSNLMISEFFG